MKRTLFISIICLLLGFHVKAQFSLSGELRPRTEYSHGYSTQAAEDQKPSVFTSQRIRINFDYKMDLLKVGLVFQDVRVWRNAGWLQQARSHDVALFKYEKKVNVQLGIAHDLNVNVKLI